MSSKSDHLSACLRSLPEPLPLEAFKQAYCDRCIQPECTRSLAAESRFEARTATWRERLFSNPASMAPDDPRRPEIESKLFLDVGDPHRSLPVLGRAQVPQTASWEDPRELAEKAKEEAPRPQPQKHRPRAQVPSDSKPEPPTPVEAPPVFSVPTQPVTRPLNTPFQQGAMVGGPPSTQSKTVPDAWSPKPEPPPASKGGAKILKPGGKFRFGK